MKVKFSKSVVFAPTFNGNLNLPAEDQFSAELSVLTTGDLLNVMDAFQSSGVQDLTDATKQVEVASLKDMLKLVDVLLPKYVKINNLTGEDGSAITINDVVVSSVFMPLQIELLMQLSTISTPSDQSTKN